MSRAILRRSYSLGILSDFLLRIRKEEVRGQSLAGSHRLGYGMRVELPRLTSVCFFSVLTFQSRCLVSLMSARIRGLVDATGACRSSADDMGKSKGYVSSIRAHKCVRISARLHWASWLCCQLQRGRTGRGRLSSQPVCTPAASISLEQVPGSQTD